MAFLRSARLLDRLLGLLDLRLAFFQTLLKVPCVHDGKHLAGGDLVALVHPQFGDAPGEFGVDVDRIGLQPAVAIDDIGGNSRGAMRLPDGVAGAAADQGEKDKPPRPHAAPARRMMLDDRMGRLRLNFRRQLRGGRRLGDRRGRGGRGLVVGFVQGRNLAIDARAKLLAGPL